MLGGLLLTFSTAVAWDVAKTPPMGFNVSHQTLYFLSSTFSAPLSTVLSTYLLPTPTTISQTWNLYGCGVNAQILKDTAQAIHDSGLQAAGYLYVNCK
jgi:hypothetical protein